MKFAATLVSLLLVVAPAARAADAPAGPDAVFQLFARPNAPGCAVGVARKGDAPIFRAYGSADLEHNVPITPDTVFEAGSVSKQFTAAAVLTLVNDGKLALGDDIRKYLPEMPDYGAAITIDMLLSHTSGLRDWGEVAALGGWPRGTRSYTNAEALQIAARQKALNYAPGAAWSYTNTGYNLLAVIVQRVSGQSLAEFTRDRLFKPLGMSHTAWRDNYRRVVPNRAQAYEPTAGGWQLDMPFEDIYGNGGLLTTVGDLLIWNEALTEGRIGAGITARMEEVATLKSGRKTSYGRGLFVQTYHEVSEIAHDGATAGYRAVSARYPSQGLAIALLCNAGNANPTYLGHKVADLYIPPAPVPAAAVAAGPPASPDELKRHVGTYLQLGPAQVLRLQVEGDHLRFPGGPILSWVGDGTYRIGMTKVVFRSNGDMETHGAEGVVVRALVKPVTPAPAELDAVAGTYASEETGATLRLTVKDGRLTLTPADRPSAAFTASPLGRDVFTRTGGVMRVIRGKGGKIVALSFNGSRVWDLRYRRVAGA
jgi:CubicO group peptidase (beta-lactamase class C family)